MTNEATGEGARPGAPGGDDGAGLAELQSLLDRRAQRLREEAPDAPDASVWYLPISATCGNFDFIGKLHH